MNTQSAGARPSPSSVSSESTPPRQELELTIKDIDRLAQDAFDRIDTICTMALAWLERPEAYRHPDILANALRTIKGCAQSTANLINECAEVVR